MWMLILELLGELSSAPGLIYAAIEPWFATIGKFFGLFVAFLIPFLNLQREAKKQKTQLESQQSANEAIKESGANVPLPASITDPMMQMYGNLQLMDSLTQAVQTNTAAINRQTGVIEKMFQFLQDAASNGAGGPPS